MENSADMQASGSGGREIDLLDFFQFLRRKLKYIAGSAAVGVLCAAVYVTLIAAPVYEATAQLYVVNSRDSVINLSDLQIGSYLTSDYQLVFQTWEVNQQVIKNLSLPYTVRELRNMLTISNPTNTRALSITVASRDAAEAARIANEFAQVAGDYISDTMLTDTPTILSSALEPVEPVRPRKKRIVFLAGALTALAAIGVLFAMYVLDDKVKTSADVEKYTGALPLAVIPISNTAFSKKQRKQ